LLFKYRKIGVAKGFESRVEETRVEKYLEWRIKAVYITARVMIYLAGSGHCQAKTDVCLEM